MNSRTGAMDLSPRISVPLYVRAVELGVSPRDPGELWLIGPRSLYKWGAYAHSIARLAANAVTPEQRRTLEDAELAHARTVSSNPLQGAEVYYRLVPHLSPRGQAAARRAAAKVLEKLADYLGSRELDQTAPEARLRYRDYWRVLTPATYPDWLRAECGRMLADHFWMGNPRTFREKLAHVHVLGNEITRGLAAALEGVHSVVDGIVTADREFGMGGWAAYTDAEVAEADRNARQEALHTLAPFLPPELHERAVKWAKALEIELPNELGARLADLPVMRNFYWYYALPEEPIPWLTVAERKPHFAALDAGTRGSMVAALVEACAAGGARERIDPAERNGRNESVPAGWDRLLEEDLPIAAPYLDTKQTRRLLALWELPNGA